MPLRNPQVRDVMAAPSLPVVEVRAAPAFELLVGLYAACTPQEVREPSWLPPTVKLPAAVAAVGERSGELWLHLFGIALEGSADLVRAVESIEPLELRRHLVGVHVPAWRTVVGKATLEAAARGDIAAQKTLLANRVYYAGRARDALESVLSLPPAETKRRVLAALRAFADEVFATREAEIAEQLAADARAKSQLQATVAPLDLIDAAAGGYRYEVEPEFDRVVLVPQLAARPWLLLCQHKRARIICYPVQATDLDPRGRLLELGRAFGDSRRVALLARLREGEASLAELTEELGLAKSTTHHHLHRLRTANLVTLRGNAAGYRYALNPAGFAEAQRLLADFPL